MDASAIAKWPNVPACYEWLALDRRGDWRLRGERVTHRGLIDFLNRNYGSDASGRWFVQNGPQRVFVDLAYTPWIFRFDGLDRRGLTSHTGQPAGAVRAALIDTEGNVLLATELGIGLLDDRDLPAFLAECRDANGEPASAEAFAELMAGQASHLTWPPLRLQSIDPARLADDFHFIARPRP